MIRTILCALCAASTILCATPAPAQDEAGQSSYKYVDIRRGDMEGYFRGGPFAEKMTGGVELVFVAENEADNMVVNADTITFQYSEEDDTSPTGALLEGNAHIVSAGNDISSPKATMNFKENRVFFTGGVRVSMEAAQDVLADSLDLDLSTGYYKLTKIRQGRINAQKLGLAGSATTPFHLSEDHITDWAGFIGLLKSESTQSAASPGKHIVGLLSAEEQDALAKGNVTTLVSQKDALIKALNGLFASPEFYDVSAWNGITLSREIRDLIADAPEAEAGRVRLNRLLFQAAFPGYVAPVQTK